LEEFWEVTFSCTENKIALCLLLEFYYVKNDGGASELLLVRKLAVVKVKLFLLNIAHALMIVQ